MRVAGEGSPFGCLGRRLGRAAGRRRDPCPDGGPGAGLDLILAGLEIGAAEAGRHIGFVGRLVPDGAALGLRVPTWPGMASRRGAVVSGRRAVYDGLGLGVTEALANEDRLGREVVSRTTSPRCRPLR